MEDFVWAKKMKMIVSLVVTLLIVTTLVDVSMVQKVSAQEENLVVNATVTATNDSVNAPVSNLVDGDTSTDYVSGSIDSGNPNFPYYVTFNWNTPQAMSLVELESWFCKGQAPTNWDIEVSNDGLSGWTKVASSGNVVWKNFDSTVEKYGVFFIEETDIKGLRIKINNANTSWGHMAITDVFIGDNLDDTMGNFPANPIEKEGYVLDISDEFNGTELNTDVWLPYYMPHWTAPEDEELARANYYFDNEAIVLSVDEDTEPWNPTYDYTVVCESIQTFEKDDLHKAPTVNPQPLFDGYSTKYGYFEIRAKNPGGSGGHVAWWMVGCQDEEWQNAEIDIVENPFHVTNNQYANIHAWSDPNISGEYLRAPLDYSLADTWHVYGFEWDPDGMKFYIDNELVSTSDQSPSYRMMTFLGIYRDCGWDGANDGIYPKDWAIDYFRVYKREGGYGDDYANLALTATATNESSPVSAARLTDDDVSTDFVSSDNLALPDYITFNWDQPQRISKVALETWYGLGQGPTNWEIQVSDDGLTNWTTVAETGDIQWSYYDDTLETYELTFTEQLNKLGLRIKVNSANLDWGHYAITDLYIGKSE